MSISIKNREAERLLEEIKARTGKGTSAVVLDLLRGERDRLERSREREIAEGLASMRKLQEDWKSRPIVDPRTPEEILDYDENGLPR